MISLLSLLFLGRVKIDGQNTLFTDAVIVTVRDTYDLVQLGFDIWNVKN